MNVNSMILIYQKTALRIFTAVKTSSLTWF